MPTWDFRERAIVDSDIPTLENYNTHYQPPPSATKVDGVLDLSRKYAPDDVGSQHVKVLALARLPQGFGTYANGLIMVYTTETIDAKGTRQTIRCAVHAPTTTPEGYSSGWVAVQNIAYNVPRGGESLSVSHIACQRVGQKALVTLTVQAAIETPPDELSATVATIDSITTYPTAAWSTEGPLPGTALTACITQTGGATPSGLLLLNLYDVSTGELALLKTWSFDLTGDGGTYTNGSFYWKLFKLDDSTYIYTTIQQAFDGTGRYVWPVFKWDGANFSLLTNTGLTTQGYKDDAEYLQSNPGNLGYAQSWGGLVRCGDQIVDITSYETQAVANGPYDYKVVATTYNWDGLKATPASTFKIDLPSSTAQHVYDIGSITSNGTGVYVLFATGDYVYFDIINGGSAGPFASGIAGGPGKVDIYNQCKLVTGRADGSALLVTFAQYGVLTPTGPTGSLTSFSFGQPTTGTLYAAEHMVVAGNGDQRILVGVAASGQLNVGALNVHSDSSLISAQSVSSPLGSTWFVDCVDSRDFILSQGVTPSPALYLIGPPLELEVASIGYLVESDLNAAMFRLPNPRKKSGGVADALLTTWGSSVFIDEAVDPGVWFGSPNLAAFATLSRLMKTASSEWAVNDTTGIIASGMVGATIQPNQNLDASSIYAHPWRAGDYGPPELWSVTVSGNTLTLSRRQWLAASYSKADITLDDDTAFNAGANHPALNPSGFAFTATATPAGSLTLPGSIAGTLHVRVVRDTKRSNVLHMVITDGTTTWTALSLNDGQTWKARKSGTPPARSGVVNGLTLTGYVAFGPITAMCFTNDNAPVFGVEDAWRYQTSSGQTIPFWAGMPTDAGGHAALFFPLSLNPTALPIGDVVYFKQVQVARHV